MLRMCWSGGRSLPPSHWDQFEVPAGSSLGWLEQHHSVAQTSNALGDALGLPPHFAGQEGRRSTLSQPAPYGSLGYSQASQTATHLPGDIRTQHADTSTNRHLRPGAKSHTWFLVPAHACSEMLAQSWLWPVNKDQEILQALTLQSRLAYVQDT